MRIKNLPSIESMNGSQDALVIEQTDGSEDKSRKVSPAQIKQYVLGNSIDDIYSVMGQNGAKNLIPYPYYSESGYSNQGMTITYDADGVFTINKVAGTATAYYRIATLNFLKPSTKYRLVFEVENATSISIFLQKPTTGDYVTINNKSSGIFVAEFETTADSQISSRAIGLSCTASDTETNATVKVMLVYASDTDDTYQPYAKTNKKLTNDIDDVYKTMGEMGAKNLIPYPYNETTQVDNGVTFTVNNDGTVIANGTANGTAQLYLVLGNVSLSAAGNLVINTNKPLILSGCPSGGGNNTYRIQYSLTDGTSYWAKTASDTGSGVEITPVDGLNSYCFDVIKIMVFDGCTVNNLTFKPMLRLASDTDNNYQPYAKTNRQLTEVIGDLSETGLTGDSVAEQLTTAKNQIATINSKLTPMNSFRIGGINGASGTLVDQCLAFARNIKNTYGVINAFEGMFFYSGTSKPTDIPENVAAWNYASGKFLIRTVDSNNNVDATIILFGYGASKIAIKTIANSVQASNWVVLGS